MSANGSTVVKTESYTYQDLRAGEYTSAQVKSHSVTVGGNTTVNTYSYDKNGNITGIVTKVNGTQTNTVRYTYDKANQLTREDDQASGTTKTWSYDKSGNVTSCKTYAYTTESVGACTDDAVFTYTDTQWGDWLNTYRENEIENDYLGNLQDEGNGWTYTWKHGRQLHSLSDGTDTWTYTYDANGMRTGRSNDDTTYTYVYNGSQLTRMTKDSANLYFTYDADGTPLTVTLNGTLYYYVTNLQGDVVAITNAAGEKVVTYTYSAWGAPLSCTGSEQHYLGRLNPLRYRGYVYDEECYLYYLESRYYSFDYFRFISPDAFASTGQGFTGNNMFAYCGNNPVNYLDTEGTDAIWIQEEGSVGTLGHTGLLVQDSDGVWYYFYWGADDTHGPIKKLFGNKAQVKLLEIKNSEDYNLHKLSDVADAVNSVDFPRGDNVTDMYYYKGDYTKTYDFLYTLNDSGGNYNLLFSNCTQVSTIGLSKTNILFLCEMAIIPNIAHCKKAFWERFVLNRSEKALKFLERKGIL